ncbi:uncharacterized protein LOC107774220 [Nicotiana tabacum]|uniref:Uncharacterized protein LOC107774220 n=1 Tax=Nicotiana tabacum TaxID=4097 RepID=A0A1S3YAZ7_TOBAC|nr:PREDICTED: zinc-regulated protein 8-like [Nicotiana tabacum]
MAQKHLHELLKEDQEPFQLKNYIADRRCQLKRETYLQTYKKPRTKIITETTSTSTSTSTLCKHACFFSFQDSPDVRKSPLNNFPSPITNCKNSPKRKVFLHIPTTTSSLLLEAAIRIQKQQNSKPKTQINKVGFGLFGSILKKLKNRSRNNKREIKNEEEISVQVKSGYFCNNSRLSSAGWSESNEEKSMDFETSSSCRSDNEEEIEEVECENKYCSSPTSPFRFSLQKCPSTGCRTPEFSSPAASPTRHKKEDKKNYEAIGLANIEQEDEEKEQCSPVSVLDPPFDDDGHEGEYEDEDEDEDEEDDDCDVECNYALVQRAQQQLLYKLRRFEKLAELDPIELEKLMLDEGEEDNDDLEEEDDDEDSLSSYRYRDFDTFASEVTIPYDMKKLVSDLLSEEKTETNSSNNREIVFGRVCRRLDSWQYVRSDTIDMMVESDLQTEFDDWKKFQEQREETAMEVEISIFRLLVQELAEELVVLA